MELKEKQKQEAIKRLEILNKKYEILKNVVDDFKKNNLLYYSEQTRLGGILYWCTKDNGAEKLVNIVKDFEEKHNAIVYHAIHAYTTMGEILHLLYVSNDEEEWEQDIEDLNNKCPLVYCHNFDNEWYCGFGIIEINGHNGRNDKNCIKE